MDILATLATGAASSSSVIAGLLVAPVTMDQDDMIPSDASARHLHWLWWRKILPGAGGSSLGHGWLEVEARAMRKIESQAETLWFVAEAFAGTWSLQAGISTLLILP